jgi:hypothetical protein
VIEFARSEEPERLIMAFLLTTYSFDLLWFSALLAAVEAELLIVVSEPLAYTTFMFLALSSVDAKMSIVQKQVITGQIVHGTLRQSHYKI